MMSCQSFQGFGKRHRPSQLTKAAPTTERGRLDQLLARQEQTIRQAFAVFVRDATSADMMQQVTQLLGRANIEGAIALLDDHIATFADVTDFVFLNVGNAEAAAWSKKLAAKAKPKISVTFNPGNARAARRMRSNRLKLVRGFTQQQKKTTRKALTTGMAQGWSAIKVARAFKDSIGLTSHQLDMIASYQRALEATSADALQRELRDRRFDPTVRSAIDSDDVLTSKQIEIMVGRYTTNMLRMRAETIARTEALKIMAQAQVEALLQTLEQTGIDRSLTVKEWATTMDARTRDKHASTNGQRRLLDKPFDVDGTTMQMPGDSTDPAQVINCRCTVLYHIANDATELAELLAA